MYWHTWTNVGQRGALSPSAGAEPRPEFSPSWAVTMVTPSQARQQQLPPSQSQAEGWSLLQTELPSVRAVLLSGGFFTGPLTTGGHIDLVAEVLALPSQGWGRGRGQAVSAVRTKQSAGCGVCQDALDHLWVLLPSPRTDLKLQLCPGLPQIPSLFFSGSSLGRGHTGGFLTQTTMATTLHQRSSSSHSPARLAPVGSPSHGRGLQPGAGGACSW